MSSSHFPIAHLRLDYQNCIGPINPENTHNYTRRKQQLTLVGVPRLPQW